MNCRSNFCTRTKIAHGFVDTIVVAFVDLGEGGASFYLYSYSNFGYWDLGVNRKRAKRWIELLAPAN